ncbi:MAG: hypothetical protein AB1540_09075 [Bdellovibrionota bacterium]
MRISFLLAALFSIFSTTLSLAQEQHPWVIQGSEGKTAVCTLEVFLAEFHSKTKDKPLRVYERKLSGNSATTIVVKRIGDSFDISSKCFFRAVDFAKTLPRYLEENISGREPARRHYVYVKWTLVDETLGFIDTTGMVTRSSTFGTRDPEELNLDNDFYEGDRRCLDENPLYTCKGRDWAAYEVIELDPLKARFTDDGVLRYEDSFGQARKAVCGFVYPNLPEDETPPEVCRRSVD